MIVLFTTIASGVEPHVDADPYVPTLDRGPFATVDTAVSVPTVVAAQTSWAVAPIRAQDTDGVVQPVIGLAWAWHLGARHAIGPLRLGIGAPVYPLRVGPDAPRVLAVVGDPQFEAMAAWDVGAFSVGGLARLGVSLGAFTRQLGYPGPFGDVGALGTWRGPVIIAINVGFRVTPTLSLVEQDHDDAAWLNVGVAWPIVERWSVAVEAVGSLPRRGLTSDTAPVELVGSARFTATDALDVSFGVGRGLSAGVGAPALRLIGGLRFAVTRQNDDVGP